MSPLRIGMVRQQLLHSPPARRRNPRGFSLCNLILFFLLFLFYAPAKSLSPQVNDCQPFRQVNDDAFGLGGGMDGTFESEESFEVEVFNGQLYLGMEADNSLGARLWRSRRGVYAPMSQADWEEVAAAANGDPFGNANREQNDHIDSLAVFGEHLYVSTANRGLSQWGINLYRSPSGNPGTWQNVLANQGAGFGNSANVNFKDMVVFQGYLCGGTQNWDDGAQVWCSQDGLSWRQMNISGFGEGAANPANRAIWSSMVFQDALYFGVQNRGNLPDDSSDDVGIAFRTYQLNDNPQWEKVFSGSAAKENRVDLLGELEGYLYLATRSDQEILIYRSPSGDAGSWQLVSLPGIDQNSANGLVPVDGAVIYDGMLYIAISNDEGFQLWRTKGELQGDGGVDWQQIGGDGLGDTRNSRAELIVFNNHLYAWVTNYYSGQKVLRSHCLPCPDGQTECEIWLPDLPYRAYFPFISGK